MSTLSIAATLQHADKAYVDEMETTHGFLIKVRDADVYYSMTRQTEGKRSK